MDCRNAYQDIPMKFLLYSVLMLCFVIVVPGCAPDSQPQQTSAERREARKKKPAQKKPPETPKPAVQADTKPYSYTSAGKADPFRPLVVDTSTLKAAAAQPRDRSFLTPLQKYELKDLKLVAIVVGEGEPTAMLEDPTGYGYVVRKGTLVGPNDGIVERILPNGLVIREKMYNSLGEVEPSISTLTIQHVD
jgi:type IV pilus assembly protein PilP